MKKLLLILITLVSFSCNAQIDIDKYRNEILTTNPKITYDECDIWKSWHLQYRNILIKVGYQIAVPFKQVETWNILGIDITGEYILIRDKEIEDHCYKIAKKYHK